ncbi:MAG: hypothetical protein ACM3ZC_12075 [Bacteroidota bacterium]
MFGFWGFLFWAIITARLAVFAVWVWKKGHRAGVLGLGFLSLATLGVLLFGTIRNGLR